MSKALFLAAAILAAGCLVPHDDSAPSLSPVPLPQEQQAPPSQALPGLDRNQTASSSSVIHLNGCLERWFGIPASEAQPSNDWYPPGGAAYPLIGIMYTYNFFLLTCERVLVDNQTLENDVHLLIVEGPFLLPEDHPNRGVYDQLMIETLTDGVALQSALADAGFPVRAASFKEEGEMPLELLVAGEGFNITFAAGPWLKDTRPPDSFDVRLHARGTAAVPHVFLDFIRIPETGDQELVPRIAWVKHEGYLLTPASGFQEGIMITHRESAELHVPLDIREAEP